MTILGIQHIHRISFILAIVGLTTFTATAQHHSSVEEVNGIEVGEVAPNFEAVDANGNAFTSAAQLERGPLLVVFYRGEWCPYCNRHLSQIQDSLDQLEVRGVKVVAISPENPSYLKKTAEKTGAGFTLLYDEGYRIAESFDVLFQPSAIKRMKYNSIGELKAAHSDNTSRLPVPATFLIGTDGRVMWRHFDRDYKQRSSVKDILEAMTP